MKESASIVNQFQDEINDMDSENMFLTYLQHQAAFSGFKPVATWSSVCKLLNGISYGRCFDKYYINNGRKSYLHHFFKYDLMWWLSSSSVFSGSIENQIIVSSTIVRAFDSYAPLLETFMDNKGITHVVTAATSVDVVQHKMLSRLLHVNLSNKVVSSKVVRTLPPIEQMKRLSIICWGAYTLDRNIIFHYEGELTHVKWDGSFVHFISYCYGRNMTNKRKVKSLQSSLRVRKYAKVHSLENVTLISRVSYKYSTNMSTNAVTMEFERFEQLDNQMVLDDATVLVMKTILSIFSLKVQLDYYYNVNQLASLASLHRCILCFLYLVTSEVVSIGPNSYYGLQLVSIHSVEAGVQLLVGLHQVHGTLDEVCDYFNAIIICDMEQDDYGISFTNNLGCEFLRIERHQMNFQQGKSMLASIISSLLQSSNTSRDNLY